MMLKAQTVGYVQWPQDATDRRRTLFLVILLEFLLYVLFCQLSINLATWVPQDVDHRHKTPQQYYCIVSCGALRRFVTSCSTVLRQRY